MLSFVHDIELIVSPVFVLANAEASFITREPNQWYTEPYASSAGTDSSAEFAQSA